MPARGRHLMIPTLFSLTLTLCMMLLPGCQSSEVSVDNPHSGDAVQGIQANPEDVEIVTLSPEALAANPMERIPIDSRQSSSRLSAFGEIKADENNVFHINSPVSGRVVQERARLGATVRSGETLALIRNLEVAKVHSQFIHEFHQNEIDIKQAQARYNLAKKTMEREKKLLEEGISPRKDFHQAEADMAVAQSQLEGLKEHRTHLKSEAGAMMGVYGNRLGSTDSESIQSTSPVTAPRAGVITQKRMTVGDQVTPDQLMYEVSDLSRVWLDVTLYPKDLATVHLGQKVSYTTDALPGKTFTGAINYLHPAAVDTSQTFVARIFLDNPGQVLKPGMSGQAKIHADLSRPKPFLPNSAIQTHGKSTFVFLSEGKDRFVKREIVLGEKIFDGSLNGYLVESGIQPGDIVVGKGSFTLKAELLKNQLGDEE